ncbi:MAG: hypothetical protein J5J00_07595 [Deltaproteobacteria bacterium]|nr:hypothetical protein [Deltaproteobacteria bacterium]
MSTNSPKATGAAGSHVDGRKVELDAGVRDDHHAASKSKNFQNQNRTHHNRQQNSRERLENDVILNNAMDHRAQARLSAASKTSAAASSGPDHAKEFALEAAVEKPKSRRDPADDFFAELVAKLGVIRAHALRQALDDKIQEHVERQSKGSGLESKAALEALTSDLARVLEKGGLLQLYHGDALADFTVKLQDFTEWEVASGHCKVSTRELAEGARLELAEERARLDSMQRAELQRDIDRLRAAVTAPNVLLTVWDLFEGKPVERREQLQSAFAAATGKTLKEAVSEVAANAGSLEAVNGLLTRGEANREVAAVLSRRIEKIATKRGEILGTLPEWQDKAELRRLDKEYEQFKSDFAAILTGRPGFAQYAQLCYQRFEDKARLAAAGERIYWLGIQQREAAGTDGNGDTAHQSRSVGTFLAAQEDLLARFGEDLRAAFRSQQQLGWRTADNAIRKADYAGAELRYSMKGWGTAVGRFDKAISGLNGYELMWVRRIFDQKYGGGETWRAWVEGDFSGKAETTRIDRMLGIGVDFGARAPAIESSKFIATADNPKEAEALLSNDRLKHDAIAAWNGLFSAYAINSSITVFTRHEESGRGEVVANARSIYEEEYLAKARERCSPEAYAVIEQVVNNGRYQPEALYAALLSDCRKFASEWGKLLAAEHQFSQQHRQEMLTAYLTATEPLLSRHPEWRAALEKEMTKTILQARTVQVASTILNLEKLSGLLRHSPIESDRARADEVQQRLEAYLREQSEFIESNAEFKAKLTEAREKARKLGASLMNQAADAVEQLHYQMKGGLFGYTGSKETAIITQELKKLIFRDIQDGTPINTQGEALVIAARLYRDRFKANLDGHLESEFSGMELKKMMALYDGDISAAAAWDIADIMSSGGSLKQGEKIAAVIEEFDNETLAPHKGQLLARTKDVFNKDAVTELNSYFERLAQMSEYPVEALCVKDFDNAIEECLNKEAELLVKATLAGDKQLAGIARLHGWLEQTNDPEKQICQMLESLVADPGGSFNKDKAAQLEARYSSEVGVGRDLRAHLRENLSGAELSWALAVLNGDNVGAAAHKLRFAMGGAMDGTDVSLIKEVFLFKAQPEEPQAESEEELKQIEAKREAALDEHRAINERVIERYHSLYPGRDFEKDLRSEVEEHHELGVLWSLIRSGELSPAQELYLCFFGDMDGCDWQQRLVELTNDKTKAEIAELDKEFRNVSGGTGLAVMAYRHMSGDAKFDLFENLRGVPESTDEKFYFIEARYKHERSGPLSMVADIGSDYGDQMDRWHKEAMDLKTWASGRDLTPEEAARLDILLNHFQRHADLFRQQKHAAADIAAGAVTVAAVVVVSVGTAGQGTVVIILLVTSTSLAATTTTKALIKGAGYSDSEMKTDAAFALADGLLMVPCSKLGSAGARKVAERVAEHQLKQQGKQVTKEAVEELTKEILSKGGLRLAIIDGAVDGAAGGAFMGLLSSAASVDWENGEFTDNLKIIGFNTAAMTFWGSAIGAGTGAAIYGKEKVTSRVKRIFVKEKADIEELSSKGEPDIDLSEAGKSPTANPASERTPPAIVEESSRPAVASGTSSTESTALTTPDSIPLEAHSQVETRLAEIESRIEDLIAQDSASDTRLLADLDQQAAQLRDELERMIAMRELGMESDAPPSIDTSTRSPDVESLAKHPQNSDNNLTRIGREIEANDLEIAELESRFRSSSNEDEQRAIFRELDAKRDRRVELKEERRLVVSDDKAAGAAEEQSQSKEVSNNEPHSPSLEKVGSESAEGTEQAIRDPRIKEIEDRIAELKYDKQRWNQDFGDVSDPYQAQIDELSLEMATVKLRDKQIAEVHEELRGLERRLRDSGDPAEQDTLVGEIDAKTEKLMELKKDREEAIEKSLKSGEEAILAGEGEPLNGARGREEDSFDEVGDSWKESSSTDEHYIDDYQPKKFEEDFNPLDDFYREKFGSKEDSGDTPQGNDDIWEGGGGGSNEGGRGTAVMEPETKVKKETADTEGDLETERAPSESSKTDVKPDEREEPALKTKEEVKTQEELETKKEVQAKPEESTDTKEGSEQKASEKQGSEAHTAPRPEEKKESASQPKQDDASNGELPPGRSSVEPKPLPKPKVTIVHGPLPARVAPHLLPKHEPKSYLKPHPHPQPQPKLSPHPHPYPHPEPHPHAVLTRVKPKKKPSDDGYDWGRAADEYRKRRIAEERMKLKPLFDEPERYTDHGIEVCSNTFHTRSPVLQKLSGCCPSCGAKPFVA